MVDKIMLREIERAFEIFNKKMLVSTGVLYINCQESPNHELKIEFTERHEKISEKGKLFDFREFKTIEGRCGKTIIVFSPVNKTVDGEGVYLIKYTSKEVKTAFEVFDETVCCFNKDFKPKKGPVIMKYYPLSKKFGYEFCAMRPQEEIEQE